MRVGIVARLLTDPGLRGWNRYTVNLLAELTRQGTHVVLYSMGPVHERHRARLCPERVLARESPRMRLLAWEHRWLPRQCRADRVDVLHSPFNFGLPWSTHCPRILTLHDAIDTVLEREGPSLRQRFGPRGLSSKLRHWSSRVRADAIITVSDHARSDLIRVLGVPAARITVVPEAADPAFTRPISDQQRVETTRRLGLTRPFVLYVGGWDPRKNVPFLVRAFAQAGLDGTDLVLAGGRPDEQAAMRTLTVSLGASDAVRLLGWVEEEDMPALYASARAFVYPSRYEGFGLQALEAMARGAPTLVARATSLPEVVGNGGETFGLEATAELVALLRRVTTDRAFREDLIARGRARAAEFSWERTARETIAVYERAIASR